MKVLVILNDAPYGSERTYNGLRLAGSLARQGAELRVFLLEGARRSTLDELTTWTLEADRVLTF